jgi:hypothetical protein
MEGSQETFDHHQEGRMSEYKIVVKITPGFPPYDSDTLSINVSDRKWAKKIAHALSLDKTMEVKLLVRDMVELDYENH